MPLKSHMKNKGQRVSELKKAVARFIARGDTKESAQEMLSRAQKQPTEDHLYQSDEDDLEILLL